MKRPDTHSINFKLFCTFLGFAALLLALIWALQIFFLDHYYEHMKMVETTKVARELKSDFKKSGFDTDELAKDILTISAKNDLRIFVRTEYNAIVTDSLGNPADGNEIYDTRYDFEMEDLKAKLAHGHFDSTTEITTGRDDRRTLEYAGYMTSAKEESKDSELPSSKGALANSSGRLPFTDGGRYILYVFSPLYPVESTVTILRSQLSYITIISILLALALAMYLALRISKPIRNITNAAAEMGKGNYSVKFPSGSYTEIDELAQTLNMAESEMEKTGQYQQDLIANVSHDLRTPLTMIKSYAEMIRDLSGDNPEKRTKHLKVIIDEADQLNTLVNDMLNLSRMQSKRMVLIPAPFDFGEAAESVMPAYRVLEEKEGYKITFHRPSGPLPVMADEPKIKQVMNNLLTNAVKYCGEDKIIIVTVKKIGGRKVRFSVADHGMGIAPEELPHVWDKYYKSSTHHVRSTEGTGLGLSIVKEILNLHQASFDVKSTVGKGSTFWFELPLEKAPKTPRGGNRLAAAGQEAEQKTAK